MQVKNPATGAIDHVANNDPTVMALVRLGLLQIVNNETGDLVETPNGFMAPKMAPAAIPEWNVSMVRSGASQAGFPAIVFTVGQQIYERFCGDPGDAHKGFGKRVVPPNVLREYAQLYKQWKRGQ